MELCLSKDLGFCSPFYLGCFHIAPWHSLCGLWALWDSLSSFPSLWLGMCTLGWPALPVVGYPLLGVHPSICIVRLIVIGYCCNCLDGQLNYWASAHWLIAVNIMYWLCDQWLCLSTIVEINEITDSISNTRNHVAYGTAERIRFCSSLKVWWPYFTWLESVCLDDAVLYFNYFSQCYNVVMV